MNKEFFDKHSKDLGCSDCSNLQYCIEREDPSYVSCAMTYYKEQVADLKAKLAESETYIQGNVPKLIEANKMMSKQLADKEAEHELLIDQFEEETEKLRKQIKQESDARKRFVEEVKNLKQQLGEYEEVMKKHNIVGVLKLDAYLTDYLNVNEETMSGKIINQLKQKLAESEENNKLLEMQLQDMERSKFSWENQYFTLYKTLKNYREVSEKQLAEKEKEIEEYAKVYRNLYNEWRDLEAEYDKECFNKDQEKISFCIEKLENLKGKIQNNIVFVNCDDYLDVIEEIDNQIKRLKEGK